MVNEELKGKYTKLKDRFEELKLQRVRIETQLESLGNQKEEALKKVLKASSSETIEEAKAKLVQVEERISEMLERAEELISEMGD